VLSTRSRRVWITGPGLDRTPIARPLA